MVEIRTERLLLREFTPEDHEETHKHTSNQQVVKFMDWGPYTEEETHQFINRRITEQTTNPRPKYKLALTYDDRIIGGCGITITSHESRQGALLFYMLPEYWGQGIATETAEALLDYGFNELKLHRIFATVDPENTASWKVLEKTGMRREAHLREERRIRGEYRDRYIYSILKQEYSSNT